MTDSTSGCDGSVTAQPDTRSWPRILLAYRDSSFPRGLIELALTAAPFLALLAASSFSISRGWWWAYPLVIPAAAFLVRLFLIQHDCGHGSFFPRRALNDWVGRAIGVVTLTPYDYWRTTHALHHAGVGNLDKRGIGDIDTLTVSEYLALPRGRRLLYRAYRHPLVLFGIGPAYLFLFKQRLPFGFMRAGWRLWLSAMATNAAIAVLVVFSVWLLGWRPLVFVHVPMVVLAGSAGVWLFYVQHQFENTNWVHGSDWALDQAALRGSSHYDLPEPLRWLTANIGIHHVHHLCSRIPSYRLTKVLRDFPELNEVGRLTLRESFGAVRLTLWDEAARRLISFRDLDTRVAA